MVRYDMSVLTWHEECTFQDGATVTPTIYEGGVNYRGKHSWVIMCHTVWLRFLLLSLFFVAPMVAAADPVEQGEMVSGIVESINLDSHTVRIRNALGQSLLLKLTKSHLFEGVVPGEQVTVVVNEKHEIIKLIATPIPELPPGHIPKP